MLPREELTELFALYTGDNIEKELVASCCLSLPSSAGRPPHRMQQAHALQRLVE